MSVTTARKVINVTGAVAQVYARVGPRRPLARAGTGTGKNHRVADARIVPSAITVYCHFPHHRAEKRERIRAMSETSGHTLSVTDLFAERDARRRHDQEALEELQRRKEEELAEFRKRLDNFQLTDAIIQSGLDGIEHSSSAARPS